MDTRRYPPRMTPDQTYPPPAPQRPGWLIPVLVAAAVLVLAIAGVAAWALLANRDMAVTGDITVTSPSGVTSVGTVCTVGGGYADIKTGTQVVIKDAVGKVLATTVLGVGTGDGGRGCRFPFRVDVPRGSDFYGVDLGRRGVVQFTADQMADGVHLTIGG